MQASSGAARTTATNAHLGGCKTHTALFAHQISEFRLNGPIRRCLLTTCCEPSRLAARKAPCGVARLLRSTPLMALTFKEVQRLFRIRPHGRVRLRDHDPAWAGKREFRDLTRKQLKARAVEHLANNAIALAVAQENLYAGDHHSVLIVLQAMDAAGKDGTIKHVMSGVNPQGCQVFSFKAPSAEELDHNFLWRYMKALPERGRIGIFNRSYYEDVLVVRVHPELLARQRLPGARDSKRFWDERYDDINRFERHLVRNGTLILKFFLNLSKRAQHDRFVERLQDPAKHWKFSFNDLEERRHWDAYQHAFEQMLRQTSTSWAPWWVVPADHKWVTRTLVGAIITQSINALGDRPPALTAEATRRLARARRELGVPRVR
jgi:PPK2 family polyphosphate:nucleotide phosphotransferase